MNLFLSLRTFFAAALLLTTTLVSQQLPAATLGINTDVFIEPEKSRIVVKNTLQFPSEMSQEQLSVEIAARQIKVNQQLINASGSADRHGNYRFYLDVSNKQKLQIDYLLPLAQPDRQSEEMPSAYLDEDFFYVGAEVHWHPHTDIAYVIDSLQVHAPQNWHINTSTKSVSKQGQTTAFAPGHFPDSLYLLGGRYVHYQMDHEGRLIELLLLNADEALAQDYLQATADYLQMYSELIGNYPYDKFSIIENHWQTGFAYPGMTLLGSRLIRMPFILYTSLPHEILHNWWGNGVFVDYRYGNWSEGLTAYMADHLLSEQRGEDVDYRLKALSRYSQFARGEDDFSLAEFRYRHNESSQAVGYSKALMLFHMLRRQLGDQQFYQQLKRFWQDYRLQTANFEDLLKLLTQPLALDQQKFINNWLYQAGAPLLQLQNIRSRIDNGNYTVSFELTQQGLQRQLQIPMTVFFTDQSEQTFRLDMVKSSQTFSMRFDKQPVSLQIDANYDLLRRLADKEIPATLGKLYAADNQWLVYPSAAPAEEQQAWQLLARQWQALFGEIKLISDLQAEKLDSDAAIWIAGWQNHLLKELAGKTADASVWPKDGNNYNPDKHQLITVTESTDGQLLGFLGLSDASEIISLARRLPHYKSYGTLIFSRASGKNLLKTQANNSETHPLRSKLEFDLNDG